jgi:NitT/TauT family transport system substrate-binding protein
MISRRQFTALAAGTAFLPRIAQAADVSMKLGNAAGIVDPQLSFATIGMHPKLGYYAAEGIALEVVNMSSSSQTMQALATGAVDFATINALTFLPVFAKNPRLDVVCAYEWCPQAYWEVSVKPDSPVQSLRDLKGKKIGIRNTGDTGYFGARGSMAEIGMDPDNDVEWISVGNGGPAGDALYRGRVDALAIWDGEDARIELAGFKLRYLPNTPMTQKLFGATYGVNRERLAKSRAAYVGLFRAMAKSTIFVAANMDVAIKLHWDLYPESKPKGIPEDQALAETRTIVGRRAPKWFAPAGAADQRMGASGLDAWKIATAYTGTTAKIPDPSALFTNDLIDDINRFDHAAIAAQAKASTL